MASRHTVDRIISHDISFLSLHNLPFFMHVKICTPICHFNWLKSSNGEQNADRLLALLTSAQSVSAFSATQSSFWPLFLPIYFFPFFFILLLRAADHAFSWLVMWQLHSDTQFSDDVVQSSHRRITLPNLSDYYWCTSHIPEFKFKGVGKARIDKFGINKAEGKWHRAAQSMRASWRYVPARHRLPEAG